MFDINIEIARITIYYHIYQTIYNINDDNNDNSDLINYYYYYIIY